MPLATAGSLLLSALLFVAVQAALVATYPRLSEPSDQPLVEAARSLRPWLGTVVLLGSVVSLVGFNAGNALGGPRFAYAMGVDRVLPGWFARVHPRFGTPHIAIATTTLLTAVLAATLEYRQLIGMSNLTISLQYLATCLAVPILRRRPGAMTGGWRMPPGPLLPLLGAVATVALMVWSFQDGWDDPQGSRQFELWFALGAAAAGVLVARLGRAAAQPGG